MEINLHKNIERILSMRINVEETMSNVEYIGLTFKSLFLDKTKESTVFLLQLKENVCTFIDAVLAYSDEFDIGSSWEEAIEKNSESALAVTAMKFLQKHQFSHKVMSLVLTSYYNCDGQLTLDCLHQSEELGPDPKYVEWAIFWNSDNCFPAGADWDSTALLTQEMLETTRRKFPEFRGSITYTSFEYDTKGAYSAMYSVNEKRFAHVWLSDFQSAVAKQPVSIFVNKALIMELYDDGEREFQTEFEHWCTAMGATSKFEDAFSAGSIHSDAFLVTITPSDFQTALMLKLSPKDMLLAKFLHWVQGWRFLDQYETSISQKQFFDKDGNPSAEVTSYVA
jgi:hypothetical protein